MNNDLIKKYIEAAELHGISTLEGNYKKANLAYKILNNVYLELKNSNTLELLNPLLKDQNTKVRSWAATHTLAINEDESLKVLESISIEKSPFGLSAKMVLKEWRAGKLKY